MDDTQLLRYARHLMLDEIGIEGQRALLAAHALVIGAGGLGSPAALYLGSAGVGRLTVVDHDRVDLTNLQRQIAHNLSRVGQPKAASLRATVAAINPDVQLRALVRRADPALLDTLVAEADVVLDCSDNFDTRHAVNAACVRHRRPLVAGAALGWDAQLTVVDPRNEASPCYACLFAPDAGHQDVACATLGVFAPLVGVVGSLQAAEALKLLLGAGRSLAGRLLMIDARTMRCDEIAITRDPGCSVCAAPRGPAGSGRISSAP
ncbi:MAG: HesA/MoeB/ThiF family protein [Burkholderiales bacterium]|nr:HesA/MoeB/ThiF family protein [Burkholderiales bacterium]